MAEAPSSSLLGRAAAVVTNLSRREARHCSKRARWTVKAAESASRRAALGPLRLGAALRAYGSVAPGATTSG